MSQYRSRLVGKTYRPGKVEGKRYRLMEGYGSHGARLAAREKARLVAEGIRRPASLVACKRKCLLLEQHPLVVDVGRRRLLGSCGCAGAAAQQPRRVWVELLRLVRLHYLRAELAERALVWVNLGLIVLNTNSND